VTNCAINKDELLSLFDELQAFITLIIIIILMVLIILVAMKFCWEFVNKYLTNLINSIFWNKFIFMYQFNMMKLCGGSLMVFQKYKILQIPILIIYLFYCLGMITIQSFICWKKEELKSIFYYKTVNWKTSKLL
jgi:hypothetical protein